MKYLKIDKDNREVILQLFNKEVDGDLILNEKGNALDCPLCLKLLRVDDFSVFPINGATFICGGAFCIMKAQEMLEGPQKATTDTKTKGATQD